MNEKECIDRIVSLLNNWKFESAWRYSQLPEFPSDIYRMIHDLSKKYGDIGWVDGSMGVEINGKVEEVMAHYKYHFIFQEGVTDYSVDEALEVARERVDRSIEAHYSVVSMIMMFKHFRISVIMDQYENNQRSKNW